MTSSIPEAAVLTRPSRASFIVRSTTGVLWLAVILAAAFLAARETGLLNVLDGSGAPTQQAEIQKLTAAISARRQVLAAGCADAATIPQAVPSAPTRSPSPNSPQNLPQDLPLPQESPGAPGQSSALPNASPATPSGADGQSRSDLKTTAAPATTAPSATPSNGRLAQQELIRRLERGTVLVLTEKASGSGFFITPTLIVTNRHVISAQRDHRVIITSKFLSRVFPGRIVAASTSHEIGAADFALIEVPPGTGAEPLSLSRSVSKLLEVVAAGYPGLAIDNDVGFRRLLQGDATAAPDLNVDDGKVSAIQDSPFGTKQLLHSASVLGGNSGGPLVDSCGRVVGINTFIAVDQQQSGRISYALSAGDLVSFLADAKIQVVISDVPCQ